MSRLLVDQSYPGATTCIVVGDLADIGEPRLRAFRHLLWCHAGPPGLPSAAVPTEIVAPSTSELEASVTRFVRRDPRHLPSLLVTAAATGADYAAAVELIHAVLEGTHRARFTRQKDGFTWQKHLLQNTPAYLAHRLPDAWRGALRGLPAFVCGAGPSLDVSVGALVAHADRAVIFAADSALRALARHGLAADFAVSVDAAKVPEKCLPAGHHPGRVVLASVSPPAWPAAVGPSPAFFLSGTQVTDDWLATQGAPRTTVAVAESCGSTALELAHHLGCDPIYLFGLDLAVDPANQARRHQEDADPSLYAKSHYDPTAALPQVPGNYAATVPCFALGDWRELDARLAARPDSRVFNVTDRGARLRGTTVVHPKDFSLTATPDAKRPRLAELPAEPVQPAAGAVARLQALGQRNHRAVPALRDALRRGGPPALAAALVPLVLDPENGRALGAFALKLMPHLMPPIEADVAFWQSLLDEFAELSALMQQVASTPR